MDMLRIEHIRILEANDTQPKHIADTWVTDRSDVMDYDKNINERLNVADSDIAVVATLLGDGLTEILCR